MIPRSRGGRILVAVVCAAVASFLSMLAAVDAGYFRRSVLDYFNARAGRSIAIDGSLQLQLFSLTPQITAEKVTIGSPAWAPGGAAAQIDRISLVLRLPGIGHALSIDRLEMDGASLHLRRDSAGRANWQWRSPDQKSGQGLPIVRSFSMPSARIELDDERRHLKFEGIVTAAETPEPRGLPSLRIDGTGQLNGKPATLGIVGDPLVSAARDRPYHFSFTEQAADTLLTGRGVLSNPFDFDAVETTFEAAGQDLKDLFFLTGVSLVNTGEYKVSGTMSRRGDLTVFTHLNAASGQSDLRGTVSVDSSGVRPHLSADLSSRFLRLADFGLHAAARDSVSERTPPLLLSDAGIQSASVRRGEATAVLRAERVQLGRQFLRSVSAKLDIDHGVATLAPLSAEFLDGKLSLTVHLDARTDPPTVKMDLSLADAQTGQWIHKGEQPLLEGLVRARVTLNGRGSSIHQVAATADGRLTAVMPHGTMRASLAELAGIDLRGLGLLADPRKPETGVRCAIASFEARAGTLTSQSLVVDTDPVLITGDGVIRLDTEDLELQLRGHPKHARLFRLHSPLVVRGTLAQPSIGIQPAKSAAQTAEAVALGVILTPVAAVLAFVDPGLAKDANCAAMLADAKARGD